MDGTDWLADQFEAHRTHLRAVAYRMLGSTAEADDAVQEAWLRLSRADTSEVVNLGGWLTTIVARVALNMLQSRKSRREEPIDEVYVPEPAGSFDPEQEALLADSMGPALLVVLDTLTPAERLAFVLHDLFAVPFDEIAPIIGRSPAAALTMGASAARGASAVAESFSGRARGARLALIDGVPGLVWARGGEPKVVFTFTVTNNKITAINLLADPDLLGKLDVEVLG